MLIRVSSNCKTHNECTKKWATKSGLQKVGCDECDRDACGWVGETQKKRIKGERWEKWGATYGRNGWAGEKQIPKEGSGKGEGRVPVGIGIGEANPMAVLWRPSVSPETPLEIELEIDIEISAEV